jgi:hypothetical protein
MAESTAQKPVGKERASWVLFSIKVGLFFVATAMFATCIGVLVSVGARQLKKPVTNALLQLNARESSYLANIPAAHPVRIVASYPDLAAAWIAKRAPAWTLPAQTRPYFADILLVLSITLRRAGAAFGLLLPLTIVLVVAIQDGLAQRELRKYGADPESALLHFEARAAFTTSIVLCTLAYVASPVALHPHLILSIMAPTAGFALALAITRFKKYL